MNEIKKITIVIYDDDKILNKDLRYILIRDFKT